LKAPGFTKRCPLARIGVLFSALLLSAFCSAVGQAAPDPPRDHDEIATDERLRAAFAVPTFSSEQKPAYVRRFASRALSDQKAIWTSPLRLSARDATWLVPLTAITAGVFASDHSISREFNNRSNDFVQRGEKTGNFALGALALGSGTLYVSGALGGNAHQRETGILAAEALANSLLVGQAIKVVSQRRRPNSLDGRSAGPLNGSFPSDHSLAAWSMASAIAHEYPGPLTKVLAYGAATAVSASRVTSRQHFASDVLVGGTLGWLIGRQLYRRHHDRELPGAEWGDDTTYTERAPRTAANMGSPYLPIDHWAYAAFDRLAAAGYLESAIFSLRPWTRLECARLLEEANQRIESGEVVPPEVLQLLQVLGSEFNPEMTRLSGGSNTAAAVDSIYARAQMIGGQPLRDGYHFGQTIVNDFGRPYSEGFNAITGIAASATAGPFAVYVNAEYQHAASPGSIPLEARQAISSVDRTPLLVTEPLRPTNRVRLLDAYVAYNLANYQISFGKQTLYWGPGDGAPMLFSNNAEPPLMLRLNRVSPFKLPSVLGRLGPVRSEFFVGRLNGHEFVSTEEGLVGVNGRALANQPFIHGQKISFKPTPNFEFSVSRTVMMGGPKFPFTASRFWTSLFSAGNTIENDPGDRRSGFDFSYRIPRLRRWLTLYTDAFTEDQISPIGYPRRSAMRPGIFLAQVPRVPRLDFRAEGSYTDLPAGLLFSGFHYYNTRYLNGYTNAGQLLGNWVGRQGYGYQAWSRYWLSPRSNINAAYRAQRVDRDFLQGGRLDDWSLGANLSLRPGVDLTARLQYERWNFPVLSAQSRSNVSATVQIAFRPRVYDKQLPPARLAPCCSPSEPKHQLP